MTPDSRRKTRPPRKGDVAADKAVYDSIRRAMHMGRLPPGARLQEPVLARVLKVSRERVRKALHRLVHEGWLEAVPNRGTVVPALSVDDIREIYEVRALLEAGIVRRLSAAIAPDQKRKLKAHVRQERVAIRRDDRASLFALSGRFHVLLAELCGNAQLAHLLGGLLARSTMHFSLSAPARFHNCAGPHDHGDIVAAIAAGKTERASRLMLAHLTGLVEMQSARPPTRGPVDLAEAFRGL
ncbi:MAG: GntR family transcriptional regulator [Enhydrobacter sp.]|nr:MAG: GntR family transcriptional regulator [Enhydrobacter sp.]